MQNVKTLNLELQSVLAALRNRTMRVICCGTLSRICQTISQ